MAISLLQKIRLALRGWSRRREEKEQEFLRKNTGWGVAAGVSPPTGFGPPTGFSPPTDVSPPSDALKRVATPKIDLDGLHAAYLDQSGRIAYYLDVESGEVVERRDAPPPDGARFKRVPTGGADIAERRAFIDTLEPSGTKDLLMKSVATPTFRTVLSSDRTVERAWYNFRNDRAIAAIESWLKTSGLR